MSGAQRRTGNEAQRGILLPDCDEGPAETDRYWNAIIGNGGQESECGWCKDKWGLSWQITPIALSEATTDPDPAVFERNEIRVRRGKGGKDRITMLPLFARAPLEEQLKRVRALHVRDMAQGGGSVMLPDALERKEPARRNTRGNGYSPPRAAFAKPRPDESGATLHKTAVQRAMQKALHDSRIPKRSTCHTLRHSFASHLLEDGYDIRTL